MYAILQHGGHQYRVAEGDHLVVDRLPAQVGEVVGLEPVLLLSDGDGVRVAAPELVGVRVAATVVGHHRGRKLRVFTYKPKKRHRRTLGFRAELTELVVERVLARGEPLPEAVPAEEAGPEVAAADQVEDTLAGPAARPAARRGRGGRTAPGREPGAGAATAPAAAPSSLREAWGQGEAPGRPAPAGEPAADEEAAPAQEAEPEATGETEPEAAQEAEPEATQETAPEAAREAEPGATHQARKPRASAGRGRAAAPTGEPGTVSTDTAASEEPPAPARPPRRRAQRRDQGGEEAG
jgi:large subunit ribosomal protein L21